MPRILLMNTNISWNKGSAAQVAGVMKAVGQSLPGAEFTLISYCFSLDSSITHRRRIRVVGYLDDVNRSLGSALALYSARLAVTLALSILWRIASVIRIRPRCLLRERYLAEFLDADVVIDLSGDSLSDVGSHPLPNLMGMLISIVLRKPLIVYSQSIGPFSACTVPIARFCLNQARAITTRERITTEYLRSIGVHSDIIREFGDCAFPMGPEAESRIIDIFRTEGIPEGPSGSYVGISVSALVYEISRRTKRKREGQENELDPYLRLVLRTVEHLTDQGHRVILISHVIGPQSWITDDRTVCQEIARRMERHRDRVWVLRGDYSPEELKGIISRCNLFIGSRMHACIAALSTGVPTVTLGWSHKYDGIMERLGIKDLSHAVREVDEHDFIRSIDNILGGGLAWPKDAAERVQREIESALMGAEIVQRVLRDNRPLP